MTSEIIYEGDLRCRLKHLFSGKEIITDAPLDNQGKAEAFSPTDLMATSAGACMLTIMGIATRTHGFEIDGAKVSVEKIMASNPRRIATLNFQLFFPNGKNYDDKQKKIIENIANTCPVMLSLHPDIEKNISLNFNL